MFFPFWFRGQDIGSDCTSSWSLLIFYFLYVPSLTCSILNKKGTSHAFLHAFQQKYTLFRYHQVCLLCDRYQATRRTNSFLISTNRRRVSPIRLNARNHIEKAKCACPNSLFLLGRLQDVTTNQIHFEHEQI